jgi:hypothetical protein
MPRPTWNGRRVTAAIRWVIARDSGICWLCGHPGANSCDHILPVKDFPELEWQRTNWKAAHLHKAGTQGGCTTPGCQCPGNKGRGTKPHTAPSSRRW